MNKVILVAVLLSIVYTVCAEHGYGHGGYNLGYGFIAGGGYGHGGHGYHRPGVAKVQVHQSPYNYQYNVNEHGPGYSKYISQGASTHGGYGGYGHGGGYGGY